MQPQLKASVVFPDHPGRQYTATLARTSSAVDPVSRTLLAELIIDNRNHELLPGAYTEVHFRVPDAEGSASYRVPANALLFRGDGLHVATVDATGHVVLKAVEIGRDYGAAVEIVHGLAANDRVIVSPPDSLTAGVVVRVVGSRPTRAAL
jgi:membrane fusion protein, multidrug efflux system